MSTLPFALYNPALLPARVLLEEFTARRPMLETLLGVVRGNLRETPPQHCLLIGTRGMGKTTTLWAIAHRVNEDPDLSREWQPVVFDEESRRVGDLADFWLEAIRQWEVATGNDNNQAGHLLSEAPGDIEVQALQAFTQLVKQSGKRALLLIDNLNDLLASIHDSEPLHRLRAHLMHASDLMIIGGATCHFDQVTSIDQPFYDFFRIFELKPLTLDEMRACLTGLAKARGDRDVEEALQQRGGSIQALHLFTGGNPRLVKTFYRLLREGLNQDIRADLERLLDEFTPYFKAIVDALPAQQQRIFDAVALAWDPVEVSRIATATRLPSNQVSAQLRALFKAGLIREASGLPKRKSYLLQDRFSNIHYLMRHGRAARNRLDWFVATVQTLFPNQQAADVLAQCLEAQPGRESEVESAYEAAVRCEPENSFFKTRLAELQSRTPSRTTGARAHVTAALTTDPSSAFTRSVYLRVGGDDPVGWSNVLPHLVSWCRTHPGSKDVFDFTLDGFLRLARLTDPARSLSLLESVPDAEPFETLRDALKACLDRDHLHRLAPERQAVAIELMKRLQPAT